jgi:hypothetical protein
MNINPEQTSAKQPSTSFFTTINFSAAWWLQLKQLGYDVIPISGKDRPRKGWPKMPKTRLRSGTGTAAVPRSECITPTCS